MATRPYDGNTMSHRHLLWIRHATVRPDPATPARSWPLTPEGREEAGRLARALRELPLPVSVVTSDERKAVETAEAVCRVLGLDPADVCADLHEVERPWTDGDYRAVAREYLRTGASPGWEARDEVLGRLSTALVGHERPEGTTIAVGHGLAMSLWAESVVEGIDAVRFWENLRFPDAWLFAEDGATFQRIAEPDAYPSASASRPLTPIPTR